MSGAHRAERAHSRQGRPLPALLLALVALLGATGGLGTLAYWNDVEAVRGGTITAGSLDLTVDGVQGPYTWSALTMEQMAPGESLAADLTIRNAGSTPFTVVMSGTATGGLATHLTVTAHVGGTATSVDLYPRKETCGGAPASATRTLGVDPQDLATTGTVGPTTGPGSSITICVVLTLPSDVPLAAQGTWIEPRFALTATQVQR